MGGYGSTRWNGQRTRPVTEDGLILDGYNMIPKVLKARGSSPGYRGQFTWNRNGEYMADIGYTLQGETFTLDYRKKGEQVPPYPVELSPNPQPKGGLRYLFLCPVQGCGRRTAKLYLPNGSRIFGCRQCHNVTYQACNESHKWDGLFRRFGADMGYSFETVKRALKEW